MKWGLMMRWLVLGMMLTCCVQAVAQTVVDDTSAGIPPDRIADATKRIKAQINDPLSLQLRSLRYGAEKNRICGMFNAKGRSGGYGDFNPFADTPAKTLLAPDFSDPGRANAMREIVAICVDK